MRRIWQLLLLGLVLASCSSSPPVNYYVLTAKSPAEVNTDASANDEKNSRVIGIGPVTVPEYLSRSGIVYYLTDNSLNVSRSHLWSESLDDAIARVEAVNLSRLDSKRFTVLFPWRDENAPDYAIRIAVTELNRHTGDQVVLNANWTIVDTKSKQIIHRDSFSRTALLGEFSYEALVETYSDLLATLSEDIDSALDNLDR